MPETFSTPPRVSDPDMHHGACVTHVSWCISGSLTSRFLWSRWRRKCSRHSRCMRNPQFYVSGKRPIGILHVSRHLLAAYQLSQPSNLVHWNTPNIRHSITVITYNTCFRIQVASCSLAHNMVFWNYSLVSNTTNVESYTIDAHLRLRIVFMLSQIFQFTLIFGVNGKLPKIMSRVVKSKTHLGGRRV